MQSKWDELRTLVNIEGVSEACCECKACGQLDGGEDVNTVVCAHVCGPVQNYDLGQPSISTTVVTIVLLSVVCLIVAFIW